MARHQHGCEGAVERLRRCLGDRAERLCQGQRLAEHGGDAEEAALDARLTGALGEGVGILERDRREAREGLEHLGVRGAKRLRLAAPTSPEYPAQAARAPDGRDDRAAEARVRRAQRAVGVAAIVGGDRRPATRDRLAGKTLVCRKLEPDQRRVEAVDGRAAQDTTGRIEQVAVRRVGLDKPRHLRHEPLEHRLQLQLARQNPCSLEQPALALE